MKSIGRAIVPIDDSGSMLYVAYQRMIDVTQMKPNLVKAACLGLREDERAPVYRRPTQESKAGLRRDARTVFPLPNRMIDDFMVGRSAAYQCDVLLVHLSLFEGTRQKRGSLLRSRKEECSAGSTIEPVDRKHVAAESIANTKHRDVVVLVPAAMNQ